VRKAKKKTLMQVRLGQTLLLQTLENAAKRKLDYCERFTGELQAL